MSRRVTTLSLSLLLGVTFHSGCGEQDRHEVMGLPAIPNGIGTPSVIISPEAVLLETPNATGPLSIAVSPDGKTVAVRRLECVFEEGKEIASESVVSLCDVASRRVLTTIKGPSSEFRPLAFSPDGRTLAVGVNSTVELYDPNTGEDRGELRSQNAFGVSGLSFSDDGGRLASAGESGFIVVWDMTSHQEIAAIRAHTRSLLGVAISPDGKFVASASDGPIVCHTNYGFFSISLACGPDYGIVRLFDVKSAKETAHIEYGGTGQAALFSPDGNFLASCSRREAKLWNLATNEAAAFGDTKEGMEIHNIAISPDGRTLGIVVDGVEGRGGSTLEARLWDIGQHRVRAVLQGQSDEIRTLVFSPDGKTLVTTGAKSVVLWNDVASVNSDFAKPKDDE